MMSHIVGCDPDTVRVGAAVTVQFESWSESLTMPVFEMQRPPDAS
ncbi:MAG: hypothetical protein ABR578_06840 [Chromatocurvus sp.]